MENKICYLKLMLEFGQEPLWWYDNDDGVIDVGLLPEWENDMELHNLMYQLSDEYDDLFINNDIEFSYVGFKDDKHKYSFYSLADLFATKVFQKNFGQYKIINNLKLEDWYSSIGNEVQDISG